MQLLAASTNTHLNSEDFLTVIRSTERSDDKIKVLTKLEDAPNMLRNVSVKQLDSWSEEGIANIQRFVDSNVVFADTSSELLDTLTWVSEKDFEVLTVLEGFKVFDQYTVSRLLSARTIRGDEYMKAESNTLKMKEKPDNIS